jgi:TolB-like protein/Tfp pilus assembly protein PilF
MLSPERWQAVERIFHGALALPASERVEFLSSSCGEDDELRREVESLLASDGQWDSPADIVGQAASEWASSGTLVGQQVAGYHVLSSLGAGGMGEVFLAEDASLGRRVALKLIPAPFSRDADRVRRFEQEARAASALNHPNIVTVYQAGEIDGRRYLATEYIEGETLRARLVAAGGALPVSVAVDVAMQVARALEAAHAAGIVHRDIKPENVMVRPDGLVKVLDFGLAKLAPDEQFSATVATGPAATRVGAVMGTPHYMAPEQAAGGTVDQRADLYSLGVVIHEMVTGTLPTPGSLDGLRRRGDARALAPIVARLLAAAPDARYQRADQLLADLAPAPRRSPAPRVTVAAVAAMLMAVAAGVGWLASRPAAPEGAGAPASTAPELVVLPYASSGLGVELQHLGLGVADAVVSQLSRLHQLQVRPTATVTVQDGTRADPVEIGRRLKVRFVLSGALSADASGITISSTLTDVESGVVRWTGRTTVPAGPALSLRDQLSEHISAGIVETVARSERPRQPAGQARDEEAYRLYLDARARMRGVIDEWQAALPLLQEAVKRDPGFADAHASLALVYRRLGSGVARNTIPRRQAMALARESALTALALDESIADAHLALADIQWAFDWDAAAAEASLKRAAALAPASPEVDYVYGRFLVERGQFEDGLARLERALARDPESAPYMHGLVQGLWLTGRMDEALQVSESALKHMANPAAMHWDRVRIFDALGKHKEAVAERVAAAVAIGAPDRARAVQEAFDTGGYPAVLRQELATQLRAGETVAVAALYAALGDIDQALDAAETAALERDRWAVRFALDPNFAPLQSHPRFVALLQRIGVRPHAP